MAYLSGGKAVSLSFLDQLPSDGFTAEENLLRDAVLAVLERQGPSSVRQVMADREVNIRQKSLLKGTVSLVDWVDRRIGGEVETVIGGGRDGARLQLRRGHSKPRTGIIDEFSGSLRAGQGTRHRQHPRDWLANLPADSFLWQEARMRDTIFDFLAAWRSPEQATLWHLETDHNIQVARHALLPPGVLLKDWIEHRIGSEVHLEPHPYTNHFIVALSYEARRVVQERIAHQSLAQRQQMWGSKGGHEPPVQSTGEQYPKEVEPLRRALARARDQLPDEFQQIMTFSDLTRAVAKSDVKLHVGMITNIGKKLDIESPAAVVRRFCADIVTLKGTKGANGPTKVDTQPPCKKQKKEHESADGPPGDDANKLGLVDGEALFAKLPADKLWSQERLLREALLNWMAKQQNEQTAEDMLLDDAMREGEVRKCADKFLGRYNVPLQDWIERRIGEEVMVGLDRHDRKTLRAEISLEPFLASTGSPVSTTNTNPKETKVTGTSIHNRLKELSDGDVTGTGAVVCDSLFNKLPTDRLWSQELFLREALLNWMARQQDEKPAEDMLLEDALLDNSIHKCVHKFLRRYNVPLEDWIERRIGEEVTVGLDIHDRLVVSATIPLETFLGSTGRAQKLCASTTSTDPKAKTAEQQNEHIGADEPLAEVTSDAGVGDCNSLFKKLPVDRLLSEELSLRESLLNWISKRQQENPAEDMLIDDAMRDRDIHKSAEMFLGRYNVPLQEWIERRIGGEVTVGFDMHDRLIMYAEIPCEPILEPNGKRQKFNTVSTTTMASKGTTAKDEKMKNKTVNTQSFFSLLPEGKLTAAEESMRGQTRRLRQQLGR